VVVEKVETVLDRAIITIKGALTENRGTTTVTAYPIKRSFRHFGNNSPTQVTTLSGTSVSQSATNFLRSLTTTYSLDANFYSGLQATEMAFDQKVDDLAAGGKLICQGLALLEFIGPVPVGQFTVVKSIQDIRSDSLIWGNLNGASTVVTLQDRLILNDEAIFGSFFGFPLGAVDIRRLQFHEVNGPELTLRAASSWPGGAFADTQIGFFGTHTDVTALTGRRLVLVHDDGTAQSVTVASGAGDLSLAGRDAVNPWMWEINFDKVPAFAREDMDEADPKVTVYGNVVDATQGKTIAQTPLGDGDVRQIFQTFALPKTPLTYLLDDTKTPAQTPELNVYVDGILWSKVDTFFAAASDDKVYVVREDADGKSYVQFGDGKTGARLSSGNGNVVAAYRVGIGAYGALAATTQPQATGKLAGLDKVYLPEPVTMGAGSESEDNARDAAPGRVQSLGRLVALSDFEAETLALPNVLKAGAAWAAPEGVPLVQLTVLTQSESDADLDKVRDTLATYNRCRGPARFPIRVSKGLRQYVYVSLNAAFDPSRRQEDIEAAIKSALGAAGEEADGIDSSRGLFSLRSLRFGQGVHTSQILGAVQEVDGVTWTSLNAMEIIPLGAPPETDPTQLAAPAMDLIPSPTLACGDTSILALHVKHLVIALSSAQTAPTCS
jgi:hypothetical protein